MCFRIVSIVTVFINKTLLSYIELDAPMFIAFYQTLISALIIVFLQLFSNIIPSFQFSDAKPFSISTIKDVSLNAYKNIY